MATIKGKVVDLADDPPAPKIRARMDWMYLMPGLTPKLLEECCRELGHIRYVKELRVTITKKLNELNERDWNELRLLCAKKLGVSPDQEITMSPRYRQWKHDLAEWQKANGVVPLEH